MSLPNDLSSFWLPFTPNRDFKRHPRLIARADGMYFYDEAGRALLDACSGLWCVNAGHNRKPYGPLVPGTDDHLPLPYDKSTMAYTRGEPDSGAHYADALESLVALHGAETIAAVIVEPFAGSAGVFGPPKDYLKRLRTLCDRHGILLIFDEVITAFGRVGNAFAAERYGVTPDIITFAKGVNNGSVPLGGVIVSDRIHQAFMNGPDHAIEFFHGNTYSGHPLACAAGLATLDLYRDEGLFERARKMEHVLEEAAHSLRGAPFVSDIRNCGLAAGIDIEPDPKAPGRRGYDAIRRAFHEQNMVIRVGGDTIALAPALIVNEDEITRMVEGVRAVLMQLS